MTVARKPLARWLIWYLNCVRELRAKARAEKDWATCDKIRDELKDAGFEVKDTKDGVTWKLNK